MQGILCMGNTVGILLLGCSMLTILEPSCQAKVRGLAFVPLPFRVLQACNPISSRLAPWHICKARRQICYPILAAAEDPGDESERNKGREMSADEGMLSLNPVEMQYMEGWNDVMYSSLRRRNAVVGELALETFYLPDPAMTPRDVINKVLKALMRNDVPYPDHGCAVAIRFSSSSNVVSEMEAVQLGNFFRSSDLRMIIMEGEHFEFMGDTVTESSVNGDHALQDILVEGLYESQMRIRWHLLKDPTTRCWLTETVTIIRPGPI